MQDIVIVPTYDRPEMLWLCLEYLSRAPEARTVDIWVVVDMHAHQSAPKQDISTVVSKFPQLAIEVQYRHPHVFLGNSYNLLTAYQDAVETQAERVYLIEDDVLIRPEFFGWHMLQLREGVACSIAVLKEPHHGPYVSLGVGFRRQTLHLIAPHCTRDYYRDMRGYCKKTFPPSPYDVEQDGLWARVLVGHQVIWASTPLAQHVGWYGYHRKRSIRPKGTLPERYEQVKKALRNHSILRQWSKDFADIHPL